MTGISLLLSDSYGVYIPQMFGKQFAPETWGIAEDDLDWATISDGPDASEWYWEAWDSILSRATHTDPNGNVWSLNQDGDLWAVCVELMTDEEYENYFGESRQAA